MGTGNSNRDLHPSHHPDAIRERLLAASKHSYVGDAVLGAIDGAVTTFAIVAGAVGGGFDKRVVVILGVANVVADGLSMAISNYQATKADEDLIAKVRAMEEKHIEEIPMGEREEIRQIYALKGFEGETLERIVGGVTSNRKLWVDTMIREEWGLAIDTPSPLKSAWVTFISFLLVGFIPLLPFLVFNGSDMALFGLSVGATAIAFLGIGIAKGKTLDRPIIRSSIETLLAGSLAAGVAYGIGWWLRVTWGV